MRLILGVLVAMCAGAASRPCAAQNVVPAGPVPQYKDTSPLKAPAGSKVALIEFEDMECPLCAHDSSIVRTAVARYKLPYLRYDYPIYEIHVWAKTAAITARYLQDKVSPEAAESFRADVFAGQQSISSPEDLSSLTRRWFADHKLQMPFVMDPAGRFTAEVQADRTLGDRIGVHETPTLFVVGPKGWTLIRNITSLYTVIDQAEADAQAETKAVPARKR